MRTTTTLTAVLLAAALTLAGCASGDDDAAGTPTGTATTGAAAPTTEPAAAVEIGTEGPFPDVSATVGEAPELSFPEGDPAPGLQRRVLTEGDRDAVEAGDLIVVDYLGQVWDGEVFDGSFDRAPAACSIGTGSVIQGWDAGLVGQPVGSRVLLSIPPELGYGEAGNPAAGIGGTDTLAFVVDILGSYGRDDGGDPSAADAAATTGPSVSGELGAPATVEIPEGTAEPTEARTTVLATGSGEPVVTGGIIVQYAVALWDNSSTGSTWEAGGPEAVNIGGGGEFDALLGVPVGSRVLLELPGVEGSAPMAAVIDIVDQFDRS